MIKIIIGDSTREDKDISEDWINKEIDYRIRDGLPVCVKLQIRTEGIDIGFATQSCPNQGGGSTKFNEAERHIIGLWYKHRLGSNDFRGLHLVSFLKQIRML